MANPFEGIITSEFKELFTNMIDSLLEDTALTVPCRLVYEATKFNLCANCVPNPISGRSTNVFQTGGPAPFFTGSCPICHGVGRLPDQQTEIIYLCVIWNYKDWIGDVPVHSPDGFVQTISKLDTLDNIKRANEVLIDTNIEQYTKHVFERDGEPNMQGFGNSSYVFTMWKRKR